MFMQTKRYTLEQSVSSLYNNLDILEEKENDECARQNSFLTVSKTHVDILHSHKNGHSSTVKILSDDIENKCYVLEAKWCYLTHQTSVVIATYKGLMIFDEEGQLLMFWHNLYANDEEESSSTFCRGITCVKGKYICVGTNSGKVLVIEPLKNSFNISKTLDNHSEPITVLDGFKQKKSNNVVDFVSADDSGLICTFKSDMKFKFVSHLSIKGKKTPCTSLKLLNANLLVAGYLNGKLRIFDMAHSTLLAEIAAHAKAVSCIDAMPMLPSSSQIISGSEDSFIRVWKISQDEPIKIKQAWFTAIKDLRISGVRFSCSNGKSFVVSGYDSLELIQFSTPS